MEKLKAIWEKIKAFALGRKKRFYIILIVISSIVLLLDVSVRAFVPDVSRLSGFSQGAVSFDTDTLTDGTSSGDASTDQAADGSADLSDAAGGEMTLPDDASQGGFASGDAMQQGGGSMPDMSSSTDGAAASDGSSGTDTGTADSGAASDGTAADGMQGGFSGDIASGDAQMPDMSGSDGSTVPGGTDTGTDASGDGSDVTADTDDTSSGTTFSLPWPMRILMGIRAAFLPIFILALLVDGLSIFLLVLVTRREKAAAEAAEKERIAEAFAEDGEVHLARSQQQKKTKISPVTWVLIIAAVIVLVLIIKVLSSATAAESAETEATVYESAVESGDISSVLPGTGTLTEEDAVEVSLPSEVEITEWYVSDGDTVSEGDVLAAVDTDSALSAIASVQEVITSLDEALAELENSDTTDTVTAAASGRVKAVYADEDDDVIDTIYDSGSLMVLSLDGLMAVSFETDADVSVGDAVTVTLSDDSEEDGTVESVLDGTVVVTLTDEGTDIGDDVTVSDADGNELGSGELYVHSELQVYAFSGTVSSVSVDEEDEVDAGDTLLSLEDVDNTFETELLVEQRSVLEEQIQTLFQLYQDGYLYAETDGVVSGLSSSDSDASGDASASDSSDSTGSTTENTTESDTSASGAVYDGVSDGFTAAAYTGSTAGAADTAGVVTSMTAAVTDSRTVLALTDDSSTDDGSTDDSSTDDSSTDDSSGSTDDSTDSGSTDDSSSSDSSSSYVNYMGIVTAMSGSTATVTMYSLDGSSDLTGTSSSVVLSGSAAIYISSGGTLTSGGSASDIAVGDTLILMYSVTDDTEELVCVIAISASSDSSSTDEDQSTQDGSTQQDTQDQSGTDMQSAGTDMTDSTGTDMTAASGTDTSALTAGTDTTAAETVTETLTEEVSTTYSVDETTLLSITPQDYIYITITVDELDILLLSVGLEAEVTLDAFPGQSFTGVVESIDTSGTNEGGNSKYTAVVRIDREEDMLAGMNASVKITLETAEDVLYVPAEAIVEDEEGTYVYTSYDEKTDTLSDPVEVETGVSDGTNVEITSGLSEGDTYWYSVLDTVNYSTSSSSSSMTFSFGGGFGGGGF